MAVETSISQYKRIVVKVGTSTLTGDGDGPDRVFINSLAAQIAAQREMGRQVIVVSSGAIQAGMGRLGVREKPRAIPQKQALASVGQGVLMALYGDIFANYDIPVGQVLLTRDDLKHRSRYINARNTFEALLSSGVLPIVNENDTVATDEIKVGDNDTLAALVTSLTDADGLLLLSDVAGLFDRNPTLHADAKLIEQVGQVTAEMEAMAGGAGTAGGTGGMVTKLAAARIATASGAAMWIANGRRAGIIAHCIDGTPGAGTFFAPSAVRPPARKRWLAFGSGTPTGRVVVNVCARRALEEEGRSLLPVGIVGVVGTFASGDLIGVEDETGELFARGLTRADDVTVRQMAGMPSTTRGEIIHRDSLVLLPGPRPIADSRGEVAANPDSRTERV